MEDSPNPYASPTHIEPAAPERSPLVSAPARPFRSGHKLALIAITLLALNGLFDLVACVSWLMQIDMLQQLDAGVIFVQSELDANDQRVQSIGVVQTGLYWLTAIAFLMWFYRVYSNLAALGGTRLQYSAGWAVGGWFVPILNFMRPCQVAQEVARHSDPQRVNASAHVSGSSALVGWWWAFFILWRVAEAAAGPLFAGAKTWQDFTIASWFGLGTSLISLTAAGLAVGVVRKINRDQADRHRLVRVAAQTIESPTIGNAYA